MIRAVAWIGLVFFFSWMICACKQKQKPDSSSKNQVLPRPMGKANKARKASKRRRVLTKADKSKQKILGLGKRKYTQLCSLCHGSKGYGDGPGARGLKIKPSAFGKGEFRITGGKFEKIMEVLKKGSLKNGMASYSWMHKKERIALAHYVLYLAKSKK